MIDPELANVIFQYIDENDPLNYLKNRIQQERSLFELKKITMSELERSERNNAIIRLEYSLADLVKARINQLLKAEINRPGTKKSTSPNADYAEFLSWDKKQTIECLNFLLSEFFATSYPDKEWNHEFISELVFQVTRLTTFLNKAEPVN